MQPVFDIELYNERLNALFSRFQSVQKVGFKDGAYKPGLDGMRRFSTVLGDPWRQYPCIHVAGTNGKGSVCSMLAAAFAAGEACPAAGGAVCAGGHPRGAGGPDSPPQKTAVFRGPRKTSRKGSPVRALPLRLLPDVTAHRVGLYTSPHLLDFRERMKIVSGDGYEMISREEVWEFLCRYEADFEGLSFFEITTGMAFWWFARRGVDAAVIEAGLGGRLDSTNIITPALSVITSIGLDHCALLGSTRSAIAREKAGIFKPGVPAVVGVRDPETAPVFEEVAAAVGAPLVFASDISAFSIPDLSPAGVHAAPTGSILSETELLARMDLCGPCQNLNLHTVLVCLSLDLPQYRTELGKVRGLRVPPSPKKDKIGEGQGFEGATCPNTGQNWGRSEEKDATCPNTGQNWGRSEENRGRSGQCGLLVRAIAESGKRTGLWGRWQRVCVKPEVVCDIGHNPPALKENFARLETLQRGVGPQAEVAQEGSATQPGASLHKTEQKNGRHEQRQRIIVYGIMADKDLAGIAPMMPSDAIWILTAPDSPRSLPAEDLKARLAELRPDITGNGVGLASKNSGRAVAIPSVAEAVQYALDLAQDLPNPLIYIGGSTFVVAEALPLFNEKTAI